MSERRLLAIDDEPEMVEFVGIVGESLGYRVEVTGNAKDFKLAFERFNPTTIVMDILMPDTNGIELVKWLVEQKNSARVVMASGVNSVHRSSLIALGEEGGFSLSFLDKPFRIESLRTVLGSAE
jgi:DNA-binding response OmpR family regulator